MNKPSTACDGTPRWPLTNPHVQTILAGSGLRAQLLSSRHKTFLRTGTRWLFTTPENVHITGATHRHSVRDSDDERPLAVLLHGWLGSIDSNYVISAGCTLFHAGYDVARINFRDHGNTEHLNRSPFISTRLNEIAHTIHWLKQTCSAKKIIIIGYSLGGNFALRLAADYPEIQNCLQQVIAICPVIRPGITLESLERNAPFYHRHFCEIWRSSLKAKRQAFPELRQMINEILQANGLRKMHEAFAPHCSDHANCDEYFQAYTLSGSRLATISKPVDILYTEDDPIIDADEFSTIDSHPLITVEPIPWGGHCGFLADLRMHSMIDHRIVQTLKRH